MGNESYYALTYPEAKNHLGVTSDTGESEILALVGAATFTIEGYLGLPLVRRSFSEDHTGGIGERLGGARRMYLRNYPVVSTGITITDDDATTIDSDDYTVIADQGILEHDWQWPAPVGRWTVVYTAGRYANTDAVEQHFKTAAKLLLGDIYNMPESNVQSKSIGDLSITYGSNTSQLGTVTMPSRVAMILDPYRSRSV